MRERLYLDVPRPSFYYHYRLSISYLCPPHDSNSCCSCVGSRWQFQLARQQPHPRDESKRRCSLPIEWNSCRVAISYHFKSSTTNCVHVHLISIVENVASCITYWVLFFDAVIFFLTLFTWNKIKCLQSQMSISGRN
jgi:hypothetical protein